MSKSSLRATYGDDPALLAAQTARYTQAQQSFCEHFGPGPVLFFRTPGRINLIGEHTDYNGGFVMPVALDKDVLFAVRSRPDRVIQAINLEAAFAPFVFTLSPEIPSGPRGDWSNYLRGAGQEICRRFDDGARIHGMDVLAWGAPPHGVPRGSGLSSSTALTVNAALALTTVNGIEISRPDLAHLCSEAEWYVGTRGGMMDQFSALLGRRDHALFLDCRPSAQGVYAWEHVLLPDSVQVMLLNSGVRHENVRGEFNQRVAECKVGVKLLQQAYPHVVQLRDATPQALGMSTSQFWETVESMLPAQANADGLVHRGLDRQWLEELIADHGLEADATFAVRSRCRHVITENARVQEGVAALRQGRAAQFGRLMSLAHASMRDDYGASCPEADALVEIVSGRPGVLGARITGAGWGGGVVALVRRGAGQAWIDEVGTAYQAQTGLQCEIYLCRPGDRAGQVGELA